jgi:transposase-like protein
MSNVVKYKNHKVCNACRKLKLKTEFHPHGRDKSRPKCKACESEEDRRSNHHRKQQDAFT